MIRYKSWKTVNLGKFDENNDDLLRCFPGMSADINGLYFSIIYFTTDVSNNIKWQQLAQWYFLVVRMHYRWHYILWLISRL
jgi:hypothetical protein